MNYNNVAIQITRLRTTNGNLLPRTIAERQNPFKCSINRANLMLSTFNNKGEELEVILSHELITNLYEFMVRNNKTGFSDLE